MTKAIIGTVRVVLGQLITNHSVTYQTIQGSADYFYSEIYKCGIKDVYFTISFTHRPQRHCDKEASIKAASKQSVIVKAY